MATNVGQDSEGSVSVEDLEKCYAAFIQRRGTRGERSIRTREGFQRLQKRYQLPARSGNGEAGQNAASEADENDRRNVLNAFSNPKILRLTSETCWRLALFGGGSSNDERDCSGMEIDAEKYSNFTLRLIQWVFPELPRREVQELTQNDWEHDRKLDELGHDGLSLHGFKLSLLDLVISCTDGTVNKCLEFLNLLARWLQHSLPPYARDITPQVVKDLVGATSSLKPQSKPAPASIVWDKIPLSLMTPCQIGPQGLYCELKVKVCSAPMAIMVLTADENPIELVLATSSKLLLDKTEINKDISRKITLNNTLCGELKRQGCWMFCWSPNTPSILLVPGSSVSRRTKTLYACFRTFGTDTHSAKSHIEEGRDESDDNNEKSPPKVETNEPLPNPETTSTPSCFTLFTSVPDQSSLRFSSKNDACHRMERMSSRIFTVEHSVEHGAAFAITLTASLLQNTNSAGGPGAAATLSSTYEAKSVFTVSDNYSTDPQDNDDKHLDAHTFVFVLKSAVLAPKKNGLKQDEAVLPQQWFTFLNGANETKTIIFEGQARSSAPVDSNEDDKKGENGRREHKRTEIYQLFIFTRHGVYIEVACTTEIPRQKHEGSKTEAKDAEEEDDPNAFYMDSEVTCAGLLKELLLLQKMRQLEKTAEPLPDMVIGTQVSTTKPVTTAESLRSKILQSRQDERRARFEALETAITSKLLHQKPVFTVDPEPDDPDERVEASPSELEKRVNQLTTFFHEMAVHQPKVDELHGGAAELAEAVAEEQLLKQFGDMFDYDEDLQNALDEEKWSTDTAKFKRRRESISTNLPRMMPVEDVIETKVQLEEGKCSWTFEDYENTAQYIEQLMIDVVEHETQQQEQRDLLDKEQKRAVITQLLASWQYTQHRVYKGATQKRIKEIEQKRRNQWMQSQHVQTHAAIVSAKRGDKPERPVFILPKQRFLVQEHSLPSNAIWEAPGTPNNQTTLLSGPLAAAGLVRPTSPQVENASQSPSKRPQRPPQRPATVSAAELPTNTLALNSAAISRVRVRRIRSAHSTARGNSTPSRIQTRQVSSVLSPSDLQQPVAVSPTETHFGVKEDNNQLPDKYADRYGDQPLATIDVDSAISAVHSPTSPVTTERKGTSTVKSPLKATVRQRKLKKKRRSRTQSDIHFRRRVQELVSISAQLQAIDDAERKDAQGIESVEELGSVPCLPTKLKPKFP